MSIISKIKLFFEEVLVEGKKVDWPRKKQTINYTIIIIVISLVTALFLGLLDLIFVKILGEIIF